MYVGTFFAIQETKAKIFNKFSNGFWMHLWNFEHILLWLIDFDLTGTGNFDGAIRTAAMTTTKNAVFIGNWL